MRETDLNDQINRLDIHDSDHSSEMKVNEKIPTNIQTKEECIKGSGSGSIITKPVSNNFAGDVVEGAAGGSIAAVSEYIETIEQENRCWQMSQSFFEALKQENERLKAKLEKSEKTAPESRLCVICLEKEPEITFLPCGHFITCVNCAPCNKNCPICRKPIKGSVRTYF